jgi:hypothetical protein
MPGIFGPGVAGNGLRRAEEVNPRRRSKNGLGLAAEQGPILSDGTLGVNRRVCLAHGQIGTALRRGRAQAQTARSP